MIPNLKSIRGNKTLYLSTTLIGLAYLILGYSQTASLRQVISINFILGLMALPMSFSYGPKSNTSYRYFIIALLFAILANFFANKTFLTFAIILSAICLIEQVFQKLPTLTIFTAIFMSSVVQYWVGVFSFPLRLSLTGIASRILGLLGSSVHNEGNVIYMNDRAYSVDPACMGVNMLLTAFLFGILLMAILQNKYIKYYNSLSIIMALIILFALSLLANIARIILLVLIPIPQGTLMHEIIGLLCIAAYVMLPSYAVLSLILKKMGKPLTTAVQHKPSKVKYIVVSHLFIMFLLGNALLKQGTTSHTNPPLPEIAHYKAKWHNDEILQYSNDTTLVYVKRINGALGGEHNPITCWLGLGYNFERINETTIRGSKIYIGILKKGNEELHTAWWYESSDDRTNSFFDCRVNMLLGNKKYAILNVTTSNRSTLLESIDKIISSKTFNDAL